MAKNENKDELERPKRSSLILCTALQTIGWLLLVDIAIAFIMTMTGVKPGAIEQKQSIENVIVLIAYWFSLDFFILGITVIIFGQLARFVFQKSDQPGLLLRWGSKILIVFACLVLFWAICIYNIYKPLLPSNMILVALILFISAVTIKAAVLVLLAQILKRVLPIIEESKVLI